MTQLEICVYFYKPIVRDQRKDDESPALGVLCSWADARPLHITKYIKGYQALYPLASILMIRSELLDIAYRRREALERRAQSAVAIVQSICFAIAGAISQDPSSQMLQWRSFAGSHLISHLSEDVRPYFFFALVHIRFMPRPLFVRSGVSGVSLTFERPTLIYTSPFRKVIIPNLPSLVDHYGRLAHEESGLTLWRELDMDLAKERRRVYIQNDVDRMIAWEDVKDYAVEARRKGFDIELEKLGGRCTYGACRS